MSIATDGGQEPRYDVYATPFVPDQLKAVNRLPAIAVPSTPVPWINFPRYVQSFAGSSFLQADPPIPPVAEQEQDVSRANEAETMP